MSFIARLWQTGLGGDTRAEDARVSPTQSHILPSIHRIRRYTLIPTPSGRCGDLYSFAALPPSLPRGREFFIDNRLVRIHSIIVMIRWTGLAHGSLNSLFQVRGLLLLRGAPLQPPAVCWHLQVSVPGLYMYIIYIYIYIYIVFQPDTSTWFLCEASEPANRARNRARNEVGRGFWV